MTPMWRNHEKAEHKKELCSPELDNESLLSLAGIAQKYRKVQKSATKKGGFENSRIVPKSPTKKRQLPASGAAPGQNVGKMLTK